MKENSPTYWAVYWEECTGSETVRGMLHEAVYSSKEEAEKEMMDAVRDDFDTHSDNQYPPPEMRRYSEDGCEKAEVDGPMYSCEYTLRPLKVK